MTEPIQFKYAFSLNAQISMIRNSCPVLMQPKNKSKVLTLSIRQPKHIVIHCIPTKQIFQQFDISKIKAIHSKFISEGKATLVIREGTKNIIYNSLAMSADGPPTQQILTQIIINKGCPESLQLLGQKIKAYFEKSSIAKNKEIKKVQTQSKQQPPNLNKKQISQIQNSKFQKFSRKSLIQNAKQQSKRVAPKQTKQITQAPIIKQKKSLFNSLSSDILLLIFSYSKLNLQYRLLSKELSNVVLHGLTSLKLKADIPEDTFQKLTKYCLKVKCRMRNIKSINHFVNNSLQGQHLISNTKWFDFSQWKQIKNKNLNQLVDIRLYYLSLNYHTSISSQALKNLKTTWLCLTSRSDPIRNQQIKDHDIITMINQFSEMTKLQIICFNGDLLSLIQNKQKIKLLKIYKMEITTKFDWKILLQFTSLQVLQIHQVVNISTSKTLECSQKINFPQTLVHLKIGEYFDITNLDLLPKGIKNLFIINQRVKNIHVYDIVLPNLQQLNVSACPLISPEAFELFTNVVLIVHWDDFVLEQWKKQFKFRNITIFNTK